MVYQLVPRSKQLRLGYKNQSVNGLSARTAQ